MLCYHPGLAYCQHSLPRSQHAGEGNIQVAAPPAEHDGRSAETDRRPEEDREHAETAQARWSVQRIYGRKKKDCHVVFFE